MSRFAFPFGTTDPNLLALQRHVALSSDRPEEGTNGHALVSNGEGYQATYQTLGSIAGTLIDAQVAESNVTQHQAALSIACTQLTGDMPDARIAESNVTQHNAALDHGTLAGTDGDDHSQYHNDARALTWLGTRSTTDLSEGTNLYYTNARADARIAAANLSALADVVAYSSLSDDEVLQYNTAAGGWRHRTLAEAGISAVGHTHDDRYYTEGEADGLFAAIGHNHDADYSALGHSHAAGDVTSGTFDNARIAESNVTQHQAALTVLESQITDGSILARVGSNETITGAWTFEDNVHISNKKLNITNDASVMGNYLNFYDTTTGEENEIGMNFTNDGKRFYILPRPGGVSAYDREFSYHFDDEEWIVEGVNFQAYTDVTIGDYSTDTERTLAIIGASGNDQTIRMGEASDNYGWRIVYEGSSSNDLYFIRHNNDATGENVLSLDRTSGAAWFRGDVILSKNQTVYAASDDGYLIFSGGDGSGSGGNIVLYGSTHASRAGDIRFRSDTTDILEWDESDSQWEFSSDVIISGSVGIGTTDPDVKLEVSGGQIGLDNNRSLQGRRTGGVFNSLILIDSSDAVGIYENKVYIKNDGSVGIGTSSPATPGLHIVAGTQVSDPAILRIQSETEANSVYGDVYAGIEFGVKDGENDAGAQQVSAYIKAVDTRSGSTSWDDGGLAFGTLTLSEASASTKMILTAEGNVGIGTTTPGSTLEVDGTVLITGDAEFEGDITVPDAGVISSESTDGSIYISGGTGSGNGANLLLCGPDLTSNEYDIFFRKNASTLMKWDDSEDEWLFYGDKVIVPDGVSTAPGLGFSGENNTGLFLWGAGILGMSVAGNIMGIFNWDAIVELKDSLLLDQGSDDDEILMFESSDVDHGMTLYLDTDHYASFAKYSSTEGGLLLRTGGESYSSFFASCLATTGNTNKSSAAPAPASISASLADGIDIKSLGSNDNLITFENDGSTVAIIDAEGDLHLDGTSSDNAFDDHNDVALLTGLRGSLMSPKAQLAAGWREFIDYARPVLAAAGVVTYNDDGHHFVSTKKLSWLMVDTIRQLSGRVDDLEEELAALKAARN